MHSGGEAGEGGRSREGEPRLTSCPLWKMGGRVSQDGGSWEGTGCGDGVIIFSNRELHSSTDAAPGMQ